MRGSTANPHAEVLALFALTALVLAASARRASAIDPIQALRED
jgi:ABC-type antimicrobial peptide transport system permease subunit